MTAKKSERLEHKGSGRGGFHRDRGDSKSGKSAGKDDKSKYPNASSGNRRDNEKRKEGGSSDKKDFSGSKSKDFPSDKKKDNHSDRRTDNFSKDRRENRNDRNSQPKEFNPIFHGQPNKVSDNSSEKLDKYERSLFGEEQDNRKKFSRDKPDPQQRYTDKSHPQKHGNNETRHNGFHNARAKGGNDQDFGQWNNGNIRRQNSNVSKEEREISNGIQSMSLYKGQNSRNAHNHNYSERNGGGYNGQAANNDHYDQYHVHEQNQYHIDQNHSHGQFTENRNHSNESKGTKGKFDRRRDNNSDKRNERSNNRQSCQQNNERSSNRHANKDKCNWQEGMRCLAKYWEDGQFYTVTITGLSPTTAVVLFNSYGNYEEVLLDDLLPMPGGNSRGKGGLDIAPTPGLPPAFKH